MVGSESSPFNRWQSLTCGQALVYLRMLRASQDGGAKMNSGSLTHFAVGHGAESKLESSTISRK